MRPFEWISIVFDLVLAAATITYAYYARGQLDAMTKQLAVLNRQAAISAKQARTARDQLIVSNRAWVGISEPIRMLTPAKFGPEKIVLEADAVLRNYGPSVALDAAWLFEAVTSLQELEGACPHVCDFATAWQSHTIGFGELGTSPGLKIGTPLFPGQDFHAPFGHVIPMKRDLRELLIVGCIVYRDQFSPRIHRTRLCAEARLDPAHLVIPAGKALQLCSRCNFAD